MADGGVGSRLPLPVLILTGLCTFIAVVISATSIWLQLKNYRKPALQRMVVRIMLMVPLYAISSFIALFSLSAAFFIDAIRDIYEAFVIYCFFVLLLSYLGGERSLLILLHGRPPASPPFPINFIMREIDVSDPYTFLFLKRGILQYVQLKPLLAIATMVLKATGKYNDGDLRANSGYLYISIIYNFSICLSLYCLAMFWICVSQDLKPFRPMPKFLCVKGILFFSFWQGIAVSILVAAGVIRSFGPYTESEYISTGLTDTLICIEMPLFAIAHLYAFSYTDFIHPNQTYVARMPISYAFRDAFGIKDVWQDMKTTLKGEGMDYREFEPSEGFMHQGLGRERRIRAGLRYSKGGKRKYWLPQPGVGQPPGVAERAVNRAITKIAGRDQGEEVHAPLLPNQAEQAYHDALDLHPEQVVDVWNVNTQNREGGFELPFGDPEDEDEELYEHCKKYIFGDYNYPVVDVSSESARYTMWREEERVLRDEQSAWFVGPGAGIGKVKWEGYGAVGTSVPRSQYHGYRDHKKERVIDHDTERAESSASGSMDVKMRWTKRPPSHSSSPSTSTSTPSTSRPISRVNSTRHSPPSKPRSRVNSQPSPAKPKSPLPPDAVDLVVEAAPSPTSPTSPSPIGRTPLKRVYRRGIVGPEGEHAEVQVNTSSPREGEEVLSAIEDEGSIVEELIEREEEAEEEGAGVKDAEIVMGVDAQGEGAVVRTTTPPAHVYGIDEGNPWS